MELKESITNTLNKYCAQEKGLYPLKSNNCISQVEQTCCIQPFNNTEKTSTSLLQLNSTCTPYHFSNITISSNKNSSFAKPTYLEYCSGREVLNHNRTDNQNTTETNLELFCYLQEPTDTTAKNDLTKNGTCNYKGIYKKTCKKEISPSNSTNPKYKCRIKENSNPFAYPFNCSNQFNISTVESLLKEPDFSMSKTNVKGMYVPSITNSNFPIKAEKICISAAILFSGLLLLFLIFRYQPGRYLSSIFKCRLKKYNRKLSYILRYRFKPDKRGEFEKDTEKLDPYHLPENELEEETCVGVENTGNDIVETRK